MLSRDSTGRRVAEHLLHAIAALALIVAAWIAVRMLDERPAAVAAGRDVSAALARWSTSESPARAHVRLTEIPSPALRDWIAALDRADTAVTWEGESFEATGLAVEPVPDPKHPVRIWVAAPGGASIVIRDSLGTLASVRAGNGEGSGVAVTAPRVEGVVAARVGNSEASAVIMESLEIRPVLVLGAAGWEGKFVMASLEEHGWKVDARLRVSPREAVVQGTSAPQIEPDRYSAVIALDRTAARYATAIEKYVRAGGGLIAIGEAAALPAFASMLGARADEPMEEREFTREPGEKPQPARHSLALAPLTGLREDAVLLERGRENAVAAVARRAGDGRVLQVGYYDTWRWRMAGIEADPVSAHRKWWAAMVSSVAHAGRVSQPAPDIVEPTPLASIVSVLGEPEKQPSRPVLAGVLDPRLLPWLFAVALAALLLEWASRRLRGAP